MGFWRSAGRAGLRGYSRDQAACCEKGDAGRKGLVKLRAIP